MLAVFFSSFRAKDRNYGIDVAVCTSFKVKTAIFYIYIHAICRQMMSILKPNIQLTDVDGQIYAPGEKIQGDIGSSSTIITACVGCLLIGSGSRKTDPHQRDKRPIMMNERMISSCLIKSLNSVKIELEQNHPDLLIFTASNNSLNLLLASLQMSSAEMSPEIPSKPAKRLAGFAGILVAVIFIQTVLVECCIILWPILPLLLIPKPWARKIFQLVAQWGQASWLGLAVTCLRFVSGTRIYIHTKGKMKLEEMQQIAGDLLMISLFYTLKRNILI